MIAADKETIVFMEEKAQEIKKQMGKNLKARREQLGYSKYKVSKLSGLSSVQITAIEEGTKDYTFPSLVKFALAVGITFSLDFQINESGTLKLDL